MNNPNNNQQITEHSHYQSHLKIVNGASAPTRGQKNQNENIEVIKMIGFIAQTVTRLRSYGENFCKKT